MGRGTTHAPTETMKMLIPKGLRNVEYRATITTTCEEHKSHTVSILGDGAEVWGVADAAIRVLENNKADPVVHFYEDGREIDWRRTLNAVNMYFALEDMLNERPLKVDIEDLLF